MNIDISKLVEIKLNEFKKLISILFIIIDNGIDNNITIIFSLKNRLYILKLGIPNDFKILIFLNYTIINHRK